MKAIRSAMAATLDKKLVAEHGYLFNKVPLVLTKDVENIKRTSELRALLEKIGMKEDLERVSITKIRAGRGKSRGRKTKNAKGPLIVVSGQCSLAQASTNLQGFDVCSVESLNAELLAPGAVPGRLVIWTEGAIERLEKEKLFLSKVEKIKNVVKKVVKNE